MFGRFLLVVGTTAACSTAWADVHLSLELFHQDVRDTGGTQENWFFYPVMDVVHERFVSGTLTSPGGAFTFQLSPTSQFFPLNSLPTFDALADEVTSGPWSFDAELASADPNAPEGTTELLQYQLDFDLGGLTAGDVIAVDNSLVPGAMTGVRPTFDWSIQGGDPFRGRAIVNAELYHVESGSLDVTITSWQPPVDLPPGERALELEHEAVREFGASAQLIGEGEGLGDFIVTGSSERYRSVTPFTVVPEPAVGVLLLVGLAGLGRFGRSGAASRS